MSVKHLTMQQIDKFDSFVTNEATQIIVELSSNLRNRNQPRIQQMTAISPNGQAVALLVSKAMATNSPQYNRLLAGWRYVGADDTWALRLKFKPRQSFLDDRLDRQYEVDEYIEEMNNR